MSKHSGHHSKDPARLLGRDNTSLPKGAGNLLSLALMGAGAICIAITLVFYATTSDKLGARQALASYHVGFLSCLAMSLGGLVFVMILHQVNAGWSALIRRQAENLMSMLVPCGLLFVPVLALSVVDVPLWKWMDPNYVAGDVLFEVKKAYFTTGLTGIHNDFFIFRAFLYFAIWIWLARSLFAFSRRQDETGDKWLTARARRRSSYGLLLFAFTTAFAAFDWAMSLDYHWFSTMFGVYYFAGAMGSGLALTTLILIMLRRAGRLQGLVHEEHFHDLGKLIFGFSVFWAYIAFSQYFLIWYANIPEETGWFYRRRNETWYDLSIVLAVGRFIVPFIILMPRPWRRSPRVLTLMTLWIIAFQVIDMFWVIRPEIYHSDYTAVTFNWLDITGVFGPLGLYFGLLIRRIAASPLVPLKDPRLPESLQHQNYV